MDIVSSCNLHCLFSTNLANGDHLFMRSHLFRVEVRVGAELSMVELWLAKYHNHML